MEVLEVNMAAALATHRAVVVVLEACLEASSVEDHRYGHESRLRETR
jgi:hypothetical protein